MAESPGIGNPYCKGYVFDERPHYLPPFWMGKYPTAHRGQGTNSDDPQIRITGTSADLRKQNANPEMENAHPAPNGLCPAAVVMLSYHEGSPLMVKKQHQHHAAHAITVEPTHRATWLLTLHNRNKARSDMQVADQTKERPTVRRTWQAVVQRRVRGVQPRAGGDHLPATRQPPGHFAVNLLRRCLSPQAHNGNAVSAVGQVATKVVLCQRTASLPIWEGNS